MLIQAIAAVTFVEAVIINATVFIFDPLISNHVMLLTKTTIPIITIIAMVAALIATLNTNLAANIVSPVNDFSNLNSQKNSFRRGALIISIIDILIIP